MNTQTWSRYCAGVILETKKQQYFNARKYPFFLNYIFKMITLLWHCHTMTGD